MVFRKATKEDLQAVSKIYAAIHTAEECGKVSIGWIRNVYPTRATAEEALKRNDLFVGVEDNVVVGAAIINKQQPDAYREGRWNHEVSEQEVMVLHTLVIDPTHSGKGYGKSFVHFYENYAFSQGCHYLRIDTNAKNNNARAMYKKLGYQEIGIVPCVFNGIKDVQLVLLEKKLSYQIRVIKESDLDSLLLVKGDASVHADRLQQQRDGKAVYLGAFINNYAIGYVLLSLDNKEDVMAYTSHEKCADMIDLLIIESLRNCGIGSQMALACEECCKENRIPYLGLDVNPTDNPAAKRLYERLGYHAVGELHLDGVYEYTDEQGNQGKYEDWCIDMIKRV